MTPFRATKGTVFEGGFRVPAIVRWPRPRQSLAQLRTVFFPASTGFRPSLMPPVIPTLLTNS